MTRMRAAILLLALSLIGAPIVSNFALSAKTAQLETSGNESTPNELGAAVLHSHANAPVSLEVAYHTTHASKLVGVELHGHQHQKSCHEQDCRGACCTLCMHCYSALSTSVPTFLSTHAAIAHDVPSLSPLLTMQRLERPPQITLLAI